MECAQEDEQVYLSIKGGLQTIPIIIGTSEACERIVSAAISTNIIIYLTKEYHMGAATSAVVIFIYQAATNFLPILGAIVSDGLLGRFLTIQLTLFACTIVRSNYSIILKLFSLTYGTVLLWLTTMIPQLVTDNCGINTQSNHACHSPTTLQLFVLFTSLAFLSIGASGVRPCTLAFGIDQFVHLSGAEKDRALKVLFDWYFVSLGGSQIISLTLLVYLQDKIGWKVGFAIPVVLMALVTILNTAASPLYIKVKPQKSIWVSLVQVIFAAIKNRRIQFPQEGNGVQYHNTRGRAMVPSRKIRFLNKACVIRMHADSSDTEVFTTNQWNVCTVEQVEDIKQTLNVVPLWSAMIISLLIQQSQSFRVLQADTMDRRVGATNFQIPAGSIPIFEVITFTLWSGCYDKYIIPFLQKITGRETVLSHKQRMGIGLIFSIATAFAASVVEATRRNKAIRQGLEYNANGTVSMSAMWLAPQCVFSGLTSAFGSVGQIEFYYSVLPKTMGSLALALLLLATGIANIAATVIVKLVKTATTVGGREGWLSDNLNQGHYDYYCFLLALLGIANFMYFLACCYWFEEPIPNQLVESHDEDEEI
ncbi:hypothetical protein EJB05_28189, partial [Eragrostis curvula]